MRKILVYSLIVFLGAITFTASYAFLPLEKNNIFLPALCKISNGTVLSVCKDLASTLTFQGGGSTKVNLNSTSGLVQIWTPLLYAHGINLTSNGGLGLPIYAGNSDSQTLKFRTIICGKGMTCANNGTSTFLNSTGIGGGGITTLNGDPTAAQVISAGSGIYISNSGATHTISANVSSVNYPFYIVYKNGTNYFEKSPTNVIVMSSNVPETVIQDAINKQQTVYLASGSYILSNGFNGIDMIYGSTLIMDYNSIIYVPNNYNSFVFRFGNGSSIHSVGFSKIFGGQIIENIPSGGHANDLWTGIMIQGSSVGSFSNTVYGTKITYPKVGIEFNGTHTQWANSNLFDNIAIYNYRRAIEFNYTGSFSAGSDGFNTNKFKDISIQAWNKTTACVDQAEHDANIFDNVQCYDLQLGINAVGTYISKNATNTQISGGLMSSNHLYDAGRNTTILDKYNGVRLNQNLNMSNKNIINIQQLIFNNTGSCTPKGIGCDPVLNSNSAGRKLIVLGVTEFLNYITLDPTRDIDISRTGHVGLAGETGSTIPSDYLSAPNNGNITFNVGGHLVQMQNKTGTIAYLGDITNGFSTSQNVGKSTGSVGVLSSPSSTIVKGRNMTGNSPITITKTNDSDISIACSTCLTGTKVDSLNALTGAVSIAGTTGNITATAGGSTITINTAYNILVTNGVNQTISKALTFTSGNTLTLSGSSVRSPLNIGVLSANPSTLVGGDVWINGGVLTFRDNSATTHANMNLESSQNVGGAKSFNNGTMKFRNPAATQVYTISTGAITGPVKLKLPLTGQTQIIWETIRNMTSDPTTSELASGDCALVIYTNNNATIKHFCNFGGTIKKLTQG